MDNGWPNYCITIGINIPSFLWCSATTEHVRYELSPGLWVPPPQIILKFIVGNSLKGKWPLSWALFTSRIHFPQKLEEQMNIILKNFKGLVGSRESSVGGVLTSKCENPSSVHRTCINKAGMVAPTCKPSTEERETNSWVIKEVGH